ncbi:MAG: hypothetical protein HQ567_06610 [Candidatus Nealsonbacteria bacterium]|nr:hypothetical protein [Candidatus Nealsonbacteria bacterium]
MAKIRWNLLRRSAVALLNDTIARMLTKEGKAARKAAREPSTFLAWLDAFYAKHHWTMWDAVEAPLFACRMADLDYPRVSEFVRQHIARSKAELTAAANCIYAALPERVASCVDAWGGPDSPRLLPPPADFTPELIANAAELWRRCELEDAKRFGTPRGGDDGREVL